MSGHPGVVRANAHLKGAYWLLEIGVEGDFGAFSPGRFLMLRVGATCDPLLRRPFGIHDVARDGSGGVVLRILYQVCGKGTALMTRLGKGDPVDLLGPLGKGYDLEGVAGRALIVGGGIGAAPLLYLARVTVERRIASTVYLGGAGADDVLGTGEFGALGLAPVTATMDGSLGFRGTVVEALEQREGEGPATVFSCGPWPMHEALAALCRRRGWRLQASVDATMACGMGLCLGCAVPAAPGKGRVHLMTCSDGPVFSLEDLAWNAPT